MTKRLVAIGNSVGLIIDKPILELLGLARDAEVEIRTDGSSLIIEPVRKRRADRLRAATNKVNANHDETFRKLSK